MNKSYNKNLDYEAIKDYCEHTVNFIEEAQNSLINRANVLTTANSIVLGGSLVSLSIMKNISLYIILSFVPSLAFSILSIFFSISILRVYPPKEIDMRELMHFRVIERLELEEFREMILNLNRDKVIDLYMLRIKATASFLVKRYRYLYYSFWFFVFTVVSFIVFLCYSMLFLQGS